MSESLRREVLRVFKKLHRTRLRTFEGDEHALRVTRNKINEEYRKLKNVTNQAAIEELNKFAQEVEHEVRTTVIQAVETAPGRIALRLTPDVLVDNASCKDQKSDKLDRESKIRAGSSYKRSKMREDQGSKIKDTKQ